MSDASLLARAARCYERAGWHDDARRCFTALEDHSAVARLHEAAGRWAAAAKAHAQAAAWQEASRCYQRADRPGDAADSLFAAGETLEGCWLLATRLQRFTRARAMAEAHHPTSPADALARQLVIARCALAHSDRTALAHGDRTAVACDEGSAAAARVREAAAALPTLAPGPSQERVATWAIAVADALVRPDLAALTHAAAQRADLPHAAERWERWAQATLGASTGIPLPT